MIGAKDDNDSKNGEEEVVEDDGVDRRSCERTPAAPGVAVARVRGRKTYRAWMSRRVDPGLIAGDWRGDEG